MMILWQQIRRFLRFYWQAMTIYRVHSPFLFDFAQAVMEEKREFYVFRQAEILRKRLLKSNEMISVTDFGAGSHHLAKRDRKVSGMAKTSLTMPMQCRYLFYIVNHYKPTTMLEMGTSFGICSLYQAFAARQARMITLEGDPAVAAVAQDNFNQLNASNIQLSLGEFEQTLTTALGTFNRLDYVFIDGNHRYAPTMQYFEQCLQHSHEDSIFIFDDIHWSAEMEQAWTAIKAHPSVTYSIDLFVCGVVFFKKGNVQKEHICLVPHRWKPWQTGLFG